MATSFIISMPSSVFRIQSAQIANNAVAGWVGELTAAKDWTDKDATW